MFPEMAAPPHDALKAGQDSSVKIDLYAAWLSAHLRNSRCLIVVDDLQHCENDPTVTMLLCRLVELLSNDVKWLFSSRVKGNLPITRWQAYGEADCPITVDDLRMTVNEALELARLWQSPATPGQIATLVEQTNGFPMSIAYAIRLSLRHGTDSDIISGTRDVTFDFLAEQVWSSIGTVDRRLLEVASYLGPLQIGAYHAAGMEGAYQQFSRLCDAVAFLDVTPEGDFSMHALFRDFIRQQILRQGATIQRERLGAAVQVLIRSEKYGEALQLLLEAREFTALCDTIESVLISNLDASLRQLILTETSSMPLAAFGPEMLAAQTEYWSWFGNSHLAFRFSDELLRREDALPRHYLCALKGLCRIADFQSEAQQRILLEEMEPILARMGRGAERVHGNAYKASFLARFPETHRDAEALIRETSLNIAMLDVRSRIDAHILLGTALYYVGDTDGALAVNRTAAELASSINDMREAARAMNNLGLIMLYVLDPDVADIFRPLQEAVEKTGSWRYSHVSHWMQATFYALWGDSDAADIARSLEFAIMPTEESQKAKLRAVRRHSENLGHLINCNYSAIIHDFARHGCPTAADAAYEILTDVGLAYALNADAANAELVLKDAERLRVSFSARASQTVITAQLNELIALCALSKWHSARRILERQGSGVSSLKRIRQALMLLSAGPPFADAVEALKTCCGQPFVGLAAVVALRVVETSKLQSQNVPGLTPAELEVLRLLAQGKSNKEIAAARSRSVETVKRQVTSLYVKLGVENRTNAVSVARGRGLLA